MYINFKQLYRSEISESEFMLLLKISQKDLELISEDDNDEIEKFLEIGLVELVKQGKTIFDRLRISKKGKQFIRNIELPNYTDEIQKLEEELVQLYQANNKEVGLRAEVKSRLTWFCKESSFRPSVIKKYVDLYLSETESLYIKNLSNLIWSPPSKMFSVHFNLKDSKLFDIICNDLRLQQSVYLDKRDKELEYLFHFGSVMPPKGMSSDFYFTNSYEGDYKHSLKLAQKLTARILK